MGFDLQTQSAPAALAPLGMVVELRELAYGEMREAMEQADKPGQAAERLLAASLVVDGVPLGYAALRALPGRFSGGIASALQRCLAMHGLTAPAGDADDDGPKA